MRHASASEVSRLPTEQTIKAGLEENTEMQWTEMRGHQATGEVTSTQVSDLLGRLIAAQETERSRIARDHGRGFDLAVARGPGRGLGLVSIDERARLLRRSVRFETKPQQGTGVHVEIPWPAEIVCSPGRRRGVMSRGSVPRGSATSEPRQ